MGKRTKNLPAIVEYERLHYYGGPYKYKQCERKDPRWRGEYNKWRQQSFSFGPRARTCFEAKMRFSTLKKNNYPFFSGENK